MGYDKKTKVTKVFSLYFAVTVLLGTRILNMSFAMLSDFETHLFVKTSGDRIIRMNLILALIFFSECCP